MINFHILQKSRDQMTISHHGRYAHIKAPDIWLDLVTSEEVDEPDPVRKAYFPVPESFEYQGTEFRKNKKSERYALFHDHESYVLMDRESQQVVLDLSEALGPLTSELTDAVTTYTRGGKPVLTVPNEGKKTRRYAVQRIHENGESLYITFDLAGSWVPGGYTGRVVMVRCQPATGQVSVVDVPFPKGVDTEDYALVYGYFENGGILFSTDGASWNKDLLLLTPDNELKVVFGKKDRYRGALRMHRIPAPGMDRYREVPLPETCTFLHHLKDDTSRLVTINDQGEVVSTSPVDMPCTKTFSKEGRTLTLDEVGDYYVINQGSKSNYLIHRETLEVKPYPLHRFYEHVHMYPTGYCAQGGGDYAYFTVDGTLPASFAKLKSLMKCREKAAIQYEKLANPVVKPFAQMLEEVGYFEGYPAKIREKAEGKASRINKKKSMMEGFRLVGFRMTSGDDFDGDYYAELLAGDPEAVEICLYTTLILDMHGVEMTRQGDQFDVACCYGKKGCHYQGLDFNDYVPELLAVINHVLRFRKYQDVNVYLAEKDGVHALLCTHEKAMLQLKDSQGLVITAASRTLDELKWCKV